MSTRATYRLSTGGLARQMICYYVHSDGYPKGAAYKFFQMHCCKNDRNSYAGRFFRANNDAEFTTSPETHIDTEYRYEIDHSGILTAWHRELGEYAIWKVIYTGPWFEFVNKHFEFVKQYVENDPFLYVFELSPHSKPKIMTITEAQTCIEEKIGYIKQAKNKGWHSQIEEVENEINRIQKQINLINKGVFKKTNVTTTNDNVSWHLCHSYTRAQALEDGELIDVSHMAKEAGFKIPVAVTRAVWDKYIKWADEDTDKQTNQDETGRLWDVLWMFSCAAVRGRNQTEVYYKLSVIPRDGRSTKPRLIQLKASLHGGDRGEPVITIMLPQED